ncbi:MAG: hypothetical protein LIO62_00495 [Clostridiales bacterium]|nr:hypothetical protein [Clostridiales bacterium]
MKLTFKMTGDEYYLGWKTKLNMMKMRDYSFFFTAALAVLLFAVTIILKFDYAMFIFTVLILFFAILRRVTEKRSIIQEYNFSKTLSGEYTIKLYEDGVEVISSYEKIFTPWQALFAVIEKGENLIILPTFRKGVFVINKNRYSSKELDEIISSLSAHTKIKGGAK